MDFETSGLDWWSDNFETYGVAIAAEGLPARFIDFRYVPNAIEWLRDVTPRITMAGWHLKYDDHVRRTLGVPDPKDYLCGMVTEALIDEHRLEYGLDAVSFDRLGRRKVDVGPKTRLGDLPPEKLAEYATVDAELTLLNIIDQRRDVRDQELERVLRLEMDLLPVLSEMEHVGVRVDIEAAHAAIPVLTAKIDQLQREINAAVGGAFNVNSTPQIRKLFDPVELNQWQYRLIDGTLCERTKSGKGPSIDQNVLKEMTHPVAVMIRRMRKLIKTRDTFVLGHVLGHVDSRGYVHPTINQTRSDDDSGTGSGRMSIVDPALQQIPARDIDTAEIVRSLFLPDEGQEWGCCDYSQVDFRTAGHLIRDPNLYRAYEENPDSDFHAIVAAMTGIPRNAEYAGAPNAKQLNLSMAFGAGSGKIAKMLGMPYEIREGWGGRMELVAGPEAIMVQETYHSRFPRMKQFAKEAANIGKARGYVHTYTGRRLRFPGGRGAHKAAGLLYQAFAAEIHKQGLINAHRAMKGTGARLLVPVHDEVNISGDKDRHGEPLRVAYCDTGDFKCRVPIRASLGFGENWFRASKK